MKRQILFFFVILFLLSKTVFTQNYYDKTYDIGYYDHPNAFIADSLGNIIVCGWFNDTDTAFTQAFAIKVDADGQEVWRITLPDTSRFYAVCVTSTGNIALVGSKNNHCYLTIVEPQNGIEVWSYIEDTVSGYWFGTVNEYYDEDESEYRLMSFKTTNGIHLIAYYKFNSLSGTYRGKYQDTVNNNIDPVYTSSNNVAPNIVWTAGILPSFHYGLVVIRNYTDIGSNAYWTFAALHTAGVEKYSETEGCVIRIFDWGVNEFYLGILVMTFVNVNVYGNAFQIVHDNFNVSGSGMIDGKKILVTGTIDNELALWFVDHALTNMEEKILSTDNPRAGIDVLGLPSEDIVIMGMESYNDTDATNLFLMKLDDSGTVSAPENTEPANFILYPNPTKDKLWIKSSKTGMQHAEVLIINAMGETVKTTTGLSKQVSVADLPQGLYVVLVINNNEIVLKQTFVKY